MSERYIESRRRLLLATAGGATMAALPTRLLASGKPARSAKYRFRFGSIYTPAAAEYTAPGIYDFVNRVQEKSDGEIAIQLIDKAQTCSEDQCADRVMNSVLDMGSSTFQNAGSVMPYSMAMDWPFLWENRAAYHNFLFSADSNRLYRDILRSKYGIVPLYGSGGMRNIMMGRKYADEPDMNSPERLRGAKIRITNSTMISNFAKSMQMMPVPLAWGELLEGLKSGLVDAAETYPSAAAGFGMYTVLSQDVQVEFCPGFSMIFMSTRALDKLPARLQEVVFESAWETMRQAYEDASVAESTLVGNGPDPSLESAYVRGGLRQVRLDAAQRQAFQQMGRVENNPELYADVRKRLDAIAGLDVYGAFQESAARMRTDGLQADKWWA